MTRRHHGPPLAHCGPASPRLFRWFFPDGQPCRALRWEYFSRREAAADLARDLSAAVLEDAPIKVRNRGSQPLAVNGQFVAPNWFTALPRGAEVQVHVPAPAAADLPDLLSAVMRGTQNPDQRERLILLRDLARALLTPKAQAPVDLGDLVRNAKGPAGDARFFGVLGEEEAPGPAFIWAAAPDPAPRPAHHLKPARHDWHPDAPGHDPWFMPTVVKGDPLPKDAELRAAARALIEHLDRAPQFAGWREFPANSVAGHVATLERILGQDDGKP